MPNATAPFRADHVGSFLRPQSVKQAWEQRDRGELDAAAVTAIEDRAIDSIIRHQEDCGLKVATDGECRRAVWSSDFFKDLDGFEAHIAERGVRFQGIEATRKHVKLLGKIGFPAHHPMLDHFTYLKKHAKVTPKMTIPSPTVAHYRTPKAMIDPVYPDSDAFFADLTETYRKAVRAFYDAGCRYLQLDDTVWAYLCSPAEREQVRQRGYDPEALVGIYAEMLGKILAERPSDMVMTTHLCRGNFRSTWVSEGGYEPVAETLLGRLDYDGYFLEYDTDRAGGFEPLRFLPKGKKRVVLGVVSSKVGTLESKDAIKRRLEEAAKYADIAQLCLSPQCGFASTEEGNIVADEEQWAKMRFVVDIAEEVWGTA